MDTGSSSTPTDNGLPSGSAVSARVIGDGEVSLWGLTPFERIRRQLGMAEVGDIGKLGSDPTQGATTLLLRADWVYEQRTIADLLARTPVILKSAETPVAAHVPTELVSDTTDYLAGVRASAPDGVDQTTVEALSPAYNRKLLKAQPPDLLPLLARNRAGLERYLFDGSYKGVTDIVTKWAWPAPARATVRACTRLGISPNAVTVSSVVLVVAATWLFWQGQYAAGLVLGWLMTFFDTVDGKLARVTVTSSNFGHILDKGTDLIHPPIWYIAWGYGLHTWGGPAGGELWGTYNVILGGYVAGRLLEGAFELLGGFVIYTWRPLDAWVRLVIARRNPNLLILTAALAFGRPETGLYLVAVWTAVSTVFLAIRVLQALFERLSRGPLESWLESVEAGDERLSARVFAHRKLPLALRST